MHEIELKLQVPAGQQRAVEAAVAGRTPLPRVRLQAAYQDTVDRALAGAGLALRLRREGRQWVQTLKGAGDDGLTRLEHNVPRGAAAMPPVDPALHAGTLAGDRLLDILGNSSATALQSLYRTDIRRRRRVLGVRTAGRPAARVELAFDTGRIISGDAAVAVCELEIELLAGSPLAVIDTARRWTSRHGLWIDVRSKAERGDLLARGQRIAAPRQAMPLVLPARVDAAAAWQSVLRNCADQVLVNASQIASGEHAPEHVHQLRVGLRRLRSAIALFDHDDPALCDGAAALFRALGAARDQAVTESEFGAELAEAMRRAGLPPEVSEEPAVSAPAVSEPILRAAASQAFLLDLLTAMHPPPSPATAALAPVRDRLAARLDAWHRQVARGARRYAELDDDQRHRLRKQAKRLRYAAEFCAGLYARKRVSRYLKTLRSLQQRLGAVSDVIMAMGVFKPLASHDARAMFALGWLAARREVLIEQAGPALKSFRKAAAFWGDG